MFYSSVLSTSSHSLLALILHCKDVTGTGMRGLIAHECMTPGQGYEVRKIILIPIPFTSIETGLPLAL